MMYFIRIAAIALNLGLLLLNFYLGQFYWALLNVLAIALLLFGAILSYDGED